MSKSAYEDLLALSVTELNKELHKINVEMYELGISLRSNQSNEIKKYHALKKKRAQIKTEMTSRLLQPAGQQ